MRILSVQLSYIYSDEYTTTHRREALSGLGFDVSKVEESGMMSLAIGCTDAQFVELTIAGERDMKVIASVTVDD